MKFCSLSQLFHCSHLLFFAKIPTNIFVVNSFPRRMVVFYWRVTIFLTLWTSCRGGFRTYEFIVIQGAWISIEREEFGSHMYFSLSVVAFFTPFYLFITWSFHSLFVDGGVERYSCWPSFTSQLRLTLIWP